LEDQDEVTQRRESRKRRLGRTRWRGGREGLEEQDEVTQRGERGGREGLEDKMK
jgi:hypothetical protein